VNLPTEPYYVKNNACTVEIKIKWIKRKQMTPLNITQTDQMAPRGIGKENNGTMLLAN
jgi:hypothetical protein